MSDKEKDNDKKKKKEKYELTEQEAQIIALMKQNATLSQQEGTLTPEQLQQLMIGGGAGFKKHAFWDTQPTASTDGNEQIPEGPIEPNKPAEELRQEPYNMPTGFAWTNVDIHDEAQRLELYELLANNYVEDDDALFRFEYSQDFLLWALTPPGNKLDFLLGVRAQKSNKLVAFISGVPTTVQVNKKDPVEVVEINFLCVHKKLRSKRLAPVLIKEITRRVNLNGVFQAVYTAGVVLPVPISSARYHHRSLNPKKLVNVGFSRVPKKMTMARLIKQYKLPNEPHLENLRPMVDADVASVTKLLTTYLSKFSLKILFTEEEVRHWLLPRPGVINSFVMADISNGNVTDLCSFYELPSKILQHDELLYAAYSFYNVATSVSLVELMRSCLILAKTTGAGADVFNALNLMDNDEFLTDLKFGLGDGNLQYYLYNWACPTMKPSQVGIVLL